mmetsp:Transcript_40996/g.98170  ORF Transcript_40996/g.98170 Transcript_40996/m.98170 type:complete len:231 (-) Transcript_40996:264-956(-)
MVHLLWSMVSTSTTVTSTSTSKSKSKSKIAASANAVSRTTRTTTTITRPAVATMVVQGIRTLITKCTTSRTTGGNVNSTATRSRGAMHTSTAITSGASSGRKSLPSCQVTRRTFIAASRSTVRHRHHPNQRRTPRRTPRTRNLRRTPPRTRNLHRVASGRTTPARAVRRTVEQDIRARTGTCTGSVRTSARRSVTIRVRTARPTSGVITGVRSGIRTPVITPRRMGTNAS